jgi:hypothetical protein
MRTQKRCTTMVTIMSVGIAAAKAGALSELIGTQKTPLTALTTERLRDVQTATEAETRRIARFGERN